MLGAAVCRRLRAHGREVLTSAIPWQDPDAAVAALVRGAETLAERDPGSGWQLYWCAGSGVVGSSEEQFRAEVRVLEEFLGVWSPACEPGRNGFFLASSAGGVYAGSVDPPFTEHTVPVPISPYGEAKRHSEQVARAFAERTGAALLVGRLSNLYGPGQDLDKPQGLVSQLCRAQLDRQPLSIYVSLDTMRDYLFVGDAAAMVVEALEAVTERGGEHVKVLASERSTTIGGLLGDLRRLSRRRPPVVMGTSATARFQVRDLRLRSLAWPPTSGLAQTPLAAGMAATLASVAAHGRTASSS
jgi:UDP-glucose 4-epimerase